MAPTLFRNKTYTHNPIVKFADIDAETTDSGRVYVLPTGERYISVTTFLSKLTEDYIAEWVVRVGEEAAKEIQTEASTRGNTIHLMCEHYLNNRPDFILSQSSRDRAFFSKMKPMLHAIDNIIAQEVALYSHRLKLAGRVDCIAEYKGVLSIIDFKTSKKEKQKDWILNYFLQCCLYSLMLEEMTGISIKNLVVIIGNDMYPPQVFQEERKKYLPILREKLLQYHLNDDGELT